MIDGVARKSDYCPPCYKQSDFYAMLYGKSRPDPFETDLQKISQAAQNCPVEDRIPDPRCNFAIPIEISRISAGAISHFV